MSPRDRINRARWSREQRARAVAIMAASLPTVEEARAKEIAALRQMAEMMKDLPHMASSREAVIARIEYLS